MHGFNAAMTMGWLQDFGRAYYLHRANATLTHEVNNRGRRLEGNADVVAAINIKERGRSSLACGESERNAQAQVNLGRSQKPAPNQQQESTEVISSASC